MKVGRRGGRRVTGTIRGLLELGTTLGATDGELLGRFVGRRDEAAFAALVERHGPMVLRTCRAALGDDHDALDAFQATFLVLARKGGSLWVRDSLGPWLHRVARRASNRARRDRERRRAAERRAAESGSSISPPRDPGRDDLAAAVQEEVDRLPERFRAVVVLCELEGLTCAQAAGTLGLPVGTVASRLSRGRDRLRGGLRRRGLDPKAGAASVVLPAGLAETTASAAARFLSSSAAPSGVAAALAIGVLRAMSRNDVWKAASLALALGASTSGVLALAARGGGAEEPPQAVAPEKVATKPEATEVRPGVVRMPVHVTGTVTPTRREPVRSSVAAGARIASLLPSGTRVKKGDVIAELDVDPIVSASLAEQRIKTENAKGRYESAKLAREVAEIAVKEYEDGIYPQEKAALLQEIQSAEAAIVRSQEQADKVKRLREDSARLLEKQGEEKTPADLGADQDAEDRLSLAKLSLERDRFVLELATSKLKVLEQYTRLKKLKELRSAVQQALSDEKAREHEAELERAKEVKLEKQLTAGRIFSPVDGVVTADPFVGDLQPGSPVQPGQIVAYVQQGDGRLGVVAYVSEVMLSLIRPGLSARMTTLDEPGREVTVDGVVETVEPHAPPPAGFPVQRGGIAVIALREPQVGAKRLPLRLHLQVRAEFVIESGPDALGVPRRGLVWYDGAYHVGVRGSDGQVEWREVVTGLFNQETVEIRSGLKAGEAAVADPDPLLSDDQRRRIAIAPPPPPGLPPIPGQESGGMGHGFQ